MLLIFQFLLSVRRWCFLYYQTSRNRAYALAQYKWSVGTILFPFYLIPILIQAELGFKFGWKPLFTKGDSIHILMTGALLFAPFVGLMLWFLNKAQQAEPIETIVGSANEKSGLNILLTVTIEFGLLILILSSLEEFIPLSR